MPSQTVSLVRDVQIVPVIMIVSVGVKGPKGSVPMFAKSRDPHAPKRSHRAGSGQLL